MATNILQGWLARPARPRGEPNGEHNSDLLEQFYATLGVAYLAARPAGADQPADHGVDAKLSSLFEAEHSWRGAYEIEQLLSLVMTKEQLDTELERRLDEAKAIGIAHVATLEKQSGAATTQELKRALMQRLLNDLQWFYSQRIQRRAANRKLTIRVSAVFLSAFFFFFLVILIQFFALPQLLAEAERGDIRENASLGQR